MKIEPALRSSMRKIQPATYRILAKYYLASKGLKDVCLLLHAGSLLSLEDAINSQIITRLISTAVGTLLRSCIIQQQSKKISIASHFRQSISFWPTAGFGVV